ncbi:hypothetical protein [Nocardioides sp. Leaf285]|uniref:hypothetical protein n=1 Tax=Nocardioides sp. Leaf285 TaxID=1736322 RepID=UPI000702FBB7|nr:hypothetical protein [Nocardioides sp. Leaf285]KQP63160.1 hypothetical protein ASF47_19310 [Nocardioides sp. Leaf285]
MAKASDHDPNEQPRLADGTYTYMRRREARMGGLGLGMSVATNNPAFLDRTLGGVERHNALVEGGYVEPIALAAVTDPRSRAKINEHWAQGIMAAEHTADGAGYPFPAAANEQADGKRIARRAYQVDEWNMRFLGSAATVRRDAAQVGKHQMEVTIQRPDGRSVVAIMLVEKVGPSNYAVEPHSTNLGESGGQVAAAVQAVLEAKRVTQVPKHVGGLMARARERAAASGVEPSQRLRSTWMESVAYDENEQMMVTKTSKGGIYGHTVPRETFEALTTSSSPGAVFNELVRKSGTAKRAEVKSCGSCHRVYSAKYIHKCPPTKPSPAPTAPSVSNTLSRQGARSVASGALAVRQRMQRRLAEV